MMGWLTSVIDSAIVRTAPYFFGSNLEVPSLRWFQEEANYNYDLKSEGEITVLLFQNAINKFGQLANHPDNPIKKKTTTTPQNQEKKSINFNQAFEDVFQEFKRAREAALRIDDLKFKEIYFIASFYMSCCHINQMKIFIYKKHNDEEIQKVANNAVRGFTHTIKKAPPENTPKLKFYLFHSFFFRARAYRHLNELQKANADYQLASLLSTGSGRETDFEKEYKEFTKSFLQHSSNSNNKSNEEKTPKKINSKKEAIKEIDPPITQPLYPFNEKLENIPAQKPKKKKNKKKLILEKEKDTEVENKNALLGLKNQISNVLKSIEKQKIAFENLLYILEEEIDNVKTDPNNAIESANRIYNQFQEIDQEMDLGSMQSELKNIQEELEHHPYGQHKKQKNLHTDIEKAAQAIKLIISLSGNIKNSHENIISKAEDVIREKKINPMDDLKNEYETSKQSQKDTFILHGTLTQSYQEIKDSLHESLTEKLKEKEEIQNYTILEKADITKGLEFKVKLNQKYKNLIFMGGEEQLAAILCYNKNLDIASKVEVNDSDAFIETDDPEALADKLVKEEKFIKGIPVIRYEGQGIAYIPLHKIGADGKRIELTVRNPKFYKGNEFITPISYCRFKYFAYDEKLDEKQYDIVSIDKNYKIGIIKDSLYYDEICHAIRYKRYLVARCMRFVHNAYLLQVLKNYKKMVSWFGSIDTKPHPKDHVCTKDGIDLISYSVFLSELNTLFKNQFASDKNQPYKEMNALLKKYSMNDEDVQPYLQAFFSELLKSEYKEKSTTSLDTIKSTCINFLKYHYKGRTFEKNKVHKDTRNEILNLVKEVKTYYDTAKTPPTEKDFQAWALELSKPPTELKNNTLFQPPQTQDKKNNTGKTLGVDL